METIQTLWKMGFAAIFILFLFMIIIFICLRSNRNEMKLIKAEKYMDKNLLSKAESTLKKIRVHSLSGREYDKYVRLTNQLDQKLYEEFGDLPVEE